MSDMKTLNTKLSGRVFVLRLDEGDDVVDSLKKFVKDNKIKGGFFKGIGALNKATILYYNSETKKYDPHTYEEDFEVTGLLGNIAWNGDEPIIHPHITLGRKDNSALAGHCGQPSIVSVTLEIYIVEVDTEVHRAHNDKWDLVLLDL
ncbi:MAG: PPC domain-containing DNA-binding protein [Promethearchaeota archaeon]